MLQQSFRRIFEWAVRCALLVFCVAVLPTGALSQQETVTLTAQDFSLPSQFQGATLSPNGDMLAFYLTARGRTAIAILDVPISGSPNLRALPLQLGHDGGPIHWASNDRLLYATFWTRSYIDRRGQNILARASSLFSASIDFTDVVSLNQPPPNMPAEAHPTPQFFHRITDLLNDDPDHILQAQSWREWATVDLYRTNIRTGELTVVEEGSPGTSEYYADHTGRARVVVGYPRTSRQNADFFMRIRSSEPGAEWIDVSRFIRDDTASFRVYGFGADPDTLYVGSNHETDTVSLYPLNMRTGRLGPVIYSHPIYDLVGIVASVETHELLGVRYVADELEYHYFSEEAEAAMETVQTIVGSDGNVSAHDVSDASERFLVYSSYADRPSDIYLYDGEVGQAHLIGSNQPRLASATLGAVLPVSYTARDGLEIPGYVTLPPGLETMDEAQELPFVVLVHGGPAVRDFRRYDYLSQFIATRGIGVLQINYRGSTGMGRAFHEAGSGQWGRGMQDDVDDAANWLIQSGHAANERVAVAGISYGGYAAMMAVTRRESPFVAAISANGVTNLPALRSHQRNFSLGLRRFDRTLEGVDLRAMSPSNRAALLDRPLLLVQGTQDVTVPPEQAEIMREALDAANRPYTYLELPNADHSISDQANRQAFLEAVEAFLTDNILQ